ncbi:MULTISPECIES: hypothetical protein [Methylotenera]|uniref:hypothetical protein n=1 Tax=Methylotenera TaxID=359407 RepID=UPI0003693D8F|nr:MULTISPECIES: hypothetical protein [Methylotenera]
MQMIKKNMLWILLLLTLAASFYVSQQDNKTNQNDDVIVPTRAETKQRSRAENSHIKQIQASPQILRPELTDEPKNIFTVFVTQAELNQKNLKAPVETPPANPFIFAGKLVDNGKIMVFLMNAEKNYSVVTGDILEEVWQVKSIVPPMMTIRYLPLKIDTQLPIGALS